MISDAKKNLTSNGNFRTPVLVVTGFLGSGKTTIISHLLQEMISEFSVAPEKIVYIKNEIGEIDLDAQMIQGKHIQTKTLNNGCICCTLVGPFTSAIDELIATQHPQQIVIEASGVADPAALALAVSAHPKLIRECVLAVIDVLNFSGYQNLSESARRQAQLTDLIVFNKVELADLAQKKAVVGYVRELNQAAPIVEAIQGKLAATMITGLNLEFLNHRLSNLPPAKHSHLVADSLSALTLQASVLAKFSANNLHNWLKSLPPKIVRIKGWVKIEGEWLIVNLVGRRVDVLSASQLFGSDFCPDQMRIICIGFYRSTWEKSVMASWRQLCES